MSRRFYMDFQAELTEVKAEIKAKEQQITDLEKKTLDFEDGIEKKKLEVEWRNAQTQLSDLKSYREKILNAASNFKPEEIPDSVVLKMLFDAFVGISFLFISGFLVGKKTGTTDTDSITTTELESIPLLQRDSNRDSRSSVGIKKRLLERKG